MSLNDNHSTRAECPPPDAHGEAALLLVESLIHGLCENATITANDAVEIAERAIAVQEDRAKAVGGLPSRSKSNTLLTEIANSLRIDADVSL